MKNTFMLNTLLAIVVFVSLLCMMLLEVFLPAIILPAINIPLIVLISLVALLLDHLIAPGSRRSYVFIVIFSFVTFAVLPLMAGFACVHDFWKYGVVGCAVFTAVTFLFSSAVHRLKTGPKARAAVFAVAVGIFLASQVFSGMIL